MVMTSRLEAADLWALLCPDRTSNGKRSCRRRPCIQSPTSGVTQREQQHLRACKNTYQAYLTDWSSQHLCEHGTGNMAFASPPLHMGILSHPYHVSAVVCALWSTKTSANILPVQKFAGRLCFWWWWAVHVVGATPKSAHAYLSTVCTRPAQDRPAPLTHTDCLPAHMPSSKTHLDEEADQARLHVHFDQRGVEKAAYFHIQHHRTAISLFLQGEVPPAFVALQRLLAVLPQAQGS